MSDVRKVQVGEVQLAYRVWGEEDAPPAVLLHCLGEDGEDWRGVVGRLAGTHRVYAPDQRGHGRSDWPGAYGFERWRDDAIGFLEALGLERVALIGHSLGAVAALLLAADRPELVARLVLEEVPVPLPAEPPQEVPEQPAGPQPFDWHAKAAVVAERNAPDPAWWDAPAKVTAPTLVIGGGESSHIPQDHLADLVERIPDARLVTVEGAGHLVHEERPGEFLAAVTSFLAP
ncbi:Pimeloyl-ACP methyl ester carboxylesterase [Streptomyces sp. 2224.1]|uniref:alpha/beta fold hydrolase n=1 Tax=unclassified Streptomyces TaxID=2593676 RepID=UPI000881A726|nr:MULTISPECIES: alpha/beta hydrolase [unclassified Streptomyces]PBC81023.1 pimeloyl-ACP methyl ester carboxylesterase [Streptomyces sp. 2321.6]SDR56654.1 Pimeloyl-ACP methyl ester carboxylesterase [Streptomyces sp. KS_16]SEB98151.1 Pimeloyl-ACP methyl ester carboxylesterase [Streptomyces sp. 2133.1]SED29144.1 Pimeloyl-ACP methyl ester carboxylesterase [Streptomyces sp. 2224.1]SEF11074.1 Pimeloyl-ACP methyl ester carboxylesterase [Streptomyces sp. 2112.3]